MNNKEKKNKKDVKEVEKNKKSIKDILCKPIYAIKNYCIKDTTRTILLMAILIAIYLVVNLWIRNINLAQVDLTVGKLYSLTDQSKNIAKSVENDINFYVWGYAEDTAVVDLLKQYNAENDKIKYQIVTANDADLVQKYNFEDGYPSVIGEVANGKKSYINDSDFYTYDENSNLVDLTEQKITNAINNLSSTETTKVYFLGGSRTNYSTEDGIYYLGSLLQDEYYEVDTIDPIADPTIPEDCDILAIMGLSSDLSDKEATNICKYIDKGGDMIITNDIDYKNTDRKLPNFQKVLDKYAITMPNKVVQETSSNAVQGSGGTLIQADLASDHEITRLMYNNNAKPVLYASGNIELDTEKMTADNITATPILKTSSSAVLSDLKSKKTEENEDGETYNTGVAIKKTVESGDESRAVVFASTSSFSDNTLDRTDSNISL